MPSNTGIPHIRNTLKQSLSTVTVYKLTRFTTECNENPEKGFFYVYNGWVNAIQFHLWENLNVKWTSLYLTNQTGQDQTLKSTTMKIPIAVRSSYTVIKLLRLTTPPKQLNSIPADTRQWLRSHALMLYLKRSNTEQEYSKGNLNGSLVITDKQQISSMEWYLWTKILSQLLNFHSPYYTH